MTTGASRVFGLDLMRATAILVVVFWHCADVLADLVPGFWFPTFFDGVDLFFVLSGYLIGGILLKYAAMEDVPLWRRLLDFWQRRWLRTLPNYYLFLVLNILLVYWGVAGGKLNHNTWGYAFFLQSVWKPLSLFFWESWSLAVEEWFYVLFPVALFGLLRLARTRSPYVFLWVVLAFLVAPLLVRLEMVDDIRSKVEMESSLRSLVIARMDTIAFGLLAAWLHHHRAVLWRRSRQFLFLVGAALLFISNAAYGQDTLYYSTTWYFSLSALSMAMLLPLLSSWVAVPRFGAPVVFVSRVSYALYLVHQPLRAYWNRLLVGQEGADGLALYFGYWAVSFVLAWLVYRFWEKRFMDMRDRIGKRILGGALTASS